MTKTETLEKVEELTKTFESKMKSLIDEIDQVKDVEEKINKGLEVKLQEEIKKLSCLFKIVRLYNTFDLPTNHYPLNTKIYLKASHQHVHRWAEVHIFDDYIELKYWNDLYFRIYEDRVVDKHSDYNITSGDVLQIIPYWYEAVVGALNEAMTSRIVFRKKQLENLKKDVAAMSEYAQIEDTDEDDHWNDYLMYLVGWISDNKDNVGDSPVTYEDYISRF